MNFRISRTRTRLYQHRPRHERTPAGTWMALFFFLFLGLFYFTSDAVQNKPPPADSTILSSASDSVRCVAVSKRLPTRGTRNNRQLPALWVQPHKEVPVPAEHMDYNKCDLAMKIEHGALFSGKKSAQSAAIYDCRLCIVFLLALVNINFDLKPSFYIHNQLKAPHSDFSVVLTQFQKQYFHCFGNFCIEMWEEKASESLRIDFNNAITFQQILPRVPCNSSISYLSKSTIMCPIFFGRRPEISLQTPWDRIRKKKFKTPRREIRHLHKSPLN